MSSNMSKIGSPRLSTDCAPFDFLKSCKNWKRPLNWFEELITNWTLRLVWVICNIYWIGFSIENLDSVVKTISVCSTSFNFFQKKSREESSGTDSGIEILINEPYENGPGGSGQYTKKVYYVLSHLPGWIRALLPKTALTIEEEAWNAYPYTKTIFKCPLFSGLSLELETKYLPDDGRQNNVFGLADKEIRNRVVGKRNK